MNIKELADKYAEFVPFCACDGNGEEEIERSKSKEQERLYFREAESPIKITNRSIDDCIRFISVLQEKHSEIKEQITSLFRLENQMRNMQLGMCNCFPSDYDGDRLLRAFDFVPVFVKKSEHWSFRHVDRQERDKYKDAYLYAKDVWQRMTEGIEAHNFGIGKMANDTEVFFTFTISNISGEFEIALPIGKKFSVRQMNDIFEHPPMQIRILYAMATMENVWHAIGRTYYIDNVSTLLKTFVEANEYKKYLPSPTIEHRECVDGHEIVWAETREIPRSIWDAIEKSRLEASVEKEQGID